MNELGQPLLGKGKAHEGSHKGGSHPAQSPAGYASAAHPSGADHPPESEGPHLRRRGRRLRAAAFWVCVAVGVLLFGATHAPERVQRLREAVRMRMEGKEPWPQRGQRRRRRPGPHLRRSPHPFHGTTTFPYHREHRPRPTLSDLLHDRPPLHHAKDRARGRTAPPEGCPCAPKGHRGRQHSRRHEKNCPCAAAQRHGTLLPPPLPPPREGGIRLDPRTG